MNTAADVWRLQTSLIWAYDYLILRSTDDGRLIYETLLLSYFTVNKDFHSEGPP